MDDERFDRWATSLSRGLSRRSLGAAAALTVFGLAAPSLAKKKGKEEEKAGAARGMHRGLLRQDLRRRWLRRQLWRLQRRRWTRVPQRMVRLLPIRDRMGFAWHGERSVPAATRYRR